MAKFKEELNALKEEFETLNKKLVELIQEELAQVTGGSTLPTQAKIPLGQFAQVASTTLDRADGNNHNDQIYGVIKLLFLYTNESSIFQYC